MSVSGHSRIYVAVYVEEIIARLQKISTLSRGLRILSVCWRYVYVAVLSFIWRQRKIGCEEIVNVECAFFVTYPLAERVSATRRHDPVSRNAHNEIP